MFNFQNSFSFFLQTIGHFLFFSKKKKKCPSNFLLMTYSYKWRLLLSPENVFISEGRLHHDKHWANLFSFVSLKTTPPCSGTSIALAASHVVAPLKAIGLGDWKGTVSSLSLTLESLTITDVSFSCFPWDSQGFICNSHLSFRPVPPLFTSVGCDLWGRLCHMARFFGISFHLFHYATLKTFLRLSD